MKTDGYLNRFIAAICILALLAVPAASCTAIHERTPDKIYIFNEESTEDGTLPSGRILKPALYFIQKGSNKMVAELRTIIVRDDESPVKSIVKELLAGPTDETLLAVAQSGITVDHVEVSADIANVYLLSHTEMTSKDKFILKLALANTLVDFLDIKYVNVFYNGLSDGFESYPQPLQQKSTGIWTDVYDEILGRNIASAQGPEGDAQAIGITIATPLYFLDASGEYLLPEVREITYTEGLYLEKIITALANGPRNTYLNQPSVAQEMSILNGYTFIQTDNGHCLTLDLSVSPVRSKYETSQEELKSYASLVYTLTSFFPHLDCVKITIDGVPVTTIGGGIDVSEGIRRSDVSGYLAGGINLYFRIKDTNLLMGVERMVNQEQVWSANIRLYELMNGPQANDGDDAWPCFPSDITEKDIIWTKVYQSTLEVNLSRNFKEQCKGMSANEEMLLVFAMVNTLTDMRGINNVQFLVDGEKTESLAGNLYFKDLFIKNPGLEQVDF